MHERSILKTHTPSSLKHSVTPLFLFIMYETSVCLVVEIIVAIFRCHCSLSASLWRSHKTFICSWLLVNDFSHSLATMLFIYICMSFLSVVPTCFHFGIAELSVAITVAHLLSLFVSQTKTAEHKSRKCHYRPHHWRDEETRIARNGQACCYKEKP